MSAAGAAAETTSPVGVAFAFAGTASSALYTVCIASYQHKLHMNSMQLLYNQAPIASFLLLYAIPFADTFPSWSRVPASKWFLLCLASQHHACRSRRLR